MSPKADHPKKEKASKLNESKEVATAPAPISQLIQKEESAKGSVSWSVYKSYAESCSWQTVSAYLVIVIASQVLSVLQNLFLADWASSNDKSSGNGGSGEITYRLTVYGILGIGFSVATVLQTIYVWVYCGMQSARKLHTSMLENILKLPQSFFDVTPLGRILNRFSKDQNNVDEVLPRTFHGYFRTLFSVLSTLAVNTIGSPFFLVFALPLGVLYIYFQRYYLSTSRELKRLDSTSRSPVYAHFQETLGGISSIRAYKKQDQFISINEERVDFNQRAAFPSISSNRWLAVRLELIGSLVVFGSAMFGVISIILYGKVNQSLVGLCLVFNFFNIDVFFNCYSNLELDGSNVMRNRVSNYFR